MIIVYKAYVKLQPDFVGVASYFVQIITNTLIKLELESQTKARDRQLSDSFGELLVYIVVKIAIT